MMTLVPLSASLPSMSPQALSVATSLGQAIRAVPQIPTRTHHVLHAGVYVRTIKMVKGAALGSVLIKRATMLIISGDVSVFTGEEHAIRMTGYNVLPASAGRKQVYIAHQDTHLTMFFPSNAKTVAEAEAEFTDETDSLFSQYNENEVVITGE